MGTTFSSSPYYSASLSIPFKNPQHAKINLQSDELAFFHALRNFHAQRAVSGLKFAFFVHAAAAQGDVAFGAVVGVGQVQLDAGVFVAPFLRAGCAGGPGLALVPWQSCVIFILSLLYCIGVSRLYCLEAVLPQLSVMVIL